MSTEPCGKKQRAGPSSQPGNGATIENSAVSRTVSPPVVDLPVAAETCSPERLSGFGAGLISPYGIGSIRSIVAVETGVSLAAKLCTPLIFCLQRVSARLMSRGIP
jgi:hypothetical protein